jgi:hypothetical protein
MNSPTDPVGIVIKEGSLEVTLPSVLRRKVAVIS